MERIPLSSPFIAPLLPSHGEQVKNYQSKAHLLEQERTCRALVKKFSCGSGGGGGGRYVLWGSRAPHATPPPRARGRPDSGNPHANAAKYARAREALTKAEAERTIVERSIRRATAGGCVGAYVAFNCEESLRRCLADYSGSESVWSLRYWLQPMPLRFRGKHRLTVTRAPE